MDRFDDDDLEDYGNSDYEDGPNMEEEEQIEQILPLVKKELVGIIVNDDIIRESIWANYMEIEPTVKELKSESYFISLIINTNWIQKNMK